jgi:hypothetical protein
MNEERALKRENKLARFDLIPPGVLWRLAEHYGRSAGKYPVNNWRKGCEWSSLYASMQRHINLFWAGVDYDVDPAMDENPEVVHHLVAALWNLVALIEMLDTHPELDDRYKEGKQDAS